MKRTKLLSLILPAIFFVATSMQAAHVTEGFESLTITNTDSWGYGKGLSNGWKIQGGSIYTSAGSTNYGLWSTAHTGSKSLEASYGSSNNAVVVIPEELTGKFVFWARKTSSSSSTKGYVDFFDMTDNGDGTYTKGTNFKYFTLTSTTWTKYEVELGDTPRLIGFSMIRSGMDDVEYDTYEIAAGPQLSVVKDSKAVASGNEYNFGLAGGEASTTYTVKNIGSEAMTATVSCTGDYTASATDLNIAAGEEETLTVTQNDVPGKKNGSLTISPEGLDAWTVSLSGTVRDPEKIYLDFETEPEGWTVESSWTINAGIAKVGYASSANRLISPIIEIEEGEELFFRYSKNTSSSYSSAWVKIYTSEDGNNWTQFGSNYCTDSEYQVWKDITISGLPTSAHYIAFAAQYMAIDDVYGFELSTKPVLAVSGPGVKSEQTFTDDFGFVKATTKHTYTVSNIGQGELNVNISSSLPEFFEVSESAMTLAAGESKTFNLTFIFTADYSKKNATVTIAPTNEGLENVVINASATAQDPETFEEDFENGIPELWTNNGWEIVNNPTYGNGTKMAYAGRYSDSNTLTTPLLRANAGDEIEIEALLPWNDETLTMEYSLDKGETWTVGFAETPAANNTLCKLHFEAPVSGDYLLRFSGRYNYIDNIRGFKYAPTEVAASTIELTYMWATMCYPADVVLAEGIQAFTVTGVSDEVLELTEITGTVEAFEPVILYSEDRLTQSLPATSFIKTDNNAIDGTSGNLLKGCKSEIMLNKSTQYILQEQYGVAAFYQINTSKPITTRAFRSYLDLEGTSLVQASRFVLEIDKVEDIETSLTKVNADSESTAFDLNARKAARLQKGCTYIINGTTVVIK